MSDYIKVEVPAEPYYLAIAASRLDIEARDIRNTLGMLNQMIADPATALAMKENLGFVFSGYDDDPREVWEIEEVRNFVCDLDDAFPYWLFFLSKFDTGLQAIYLCLMPLVKLEARAAVVPDRLYDLLTNRWLPAMNHMCEFTGCVTENEALTERSVSYLMEGPFQMVHNYK